MDFLDDAQKVLYDQCKYKVKVWEHNFKKINGRLPSRLDIKEANSDVRYAYKTYFQLKTSILEQSFIDVDGFNFENEKSQPSETEVNLKLSVPIKPCEKCEDSDEQKHITLKTKVPSKSNNVNAKITQKLSAGSKIIKRNPRKSLPQVKSDSSISLISNIPTNSTQQISCSQPMELSAEIENFDFDFPNGTKIAFFNKVSSSQPINVIQKVLDRKSNDSFKLKDVDLDWLQRVETSAKYEQTNEKPESKVSSDEDIIDNSDEESSRNFKKFKCSKNISNLNMVLKNAEKERNECQERDINLPIHSESSINSEKYAEICINSDEHKEATFNSRKCIETASRIEDSLPACLTNSKLKNINENYIRINLKKKIYARGKKTQNFSKFKKKNWKNSKKILSEQNEGINENNRDRKQDTLLPLVGLTLSEDEDYLTTLDKASGRKPELQESASQIDSDESEDDMNLAQLKKKTIEFKMLNSVICEKNDQEEPIKKENCKNIRKVNKKLTIKSRKDVDKKEIARTRIKTNNTKTVNYNVNEHLFASEDDLFWETSDIYANLNLKDIPPLYMDYKETPQEVHDALRSFGYTSFRPGQEESIRRILCGKSTLVSLSTGSGKSLCYQLPAYLYRKTYKCITLVVSPLIALMEDQISCTPGSLRAACMHSNQNKIQRNKIIQTVKDGEIDILMLSPEAIISSFGAIISEIPPIAFACLDEAHCLSQWSHNFRPSYLIVCKILQETLGVKTILGLTATATKATRESLVKQLNISDGAHGVIIDTPVPSNLKLTVSNDANKVEALVSLLTSDPFLDYKSIIIYCLRREQCEKVATLLRTTLKNDADDYNSKKRKRRHSVVAEAYHAGLSAASRKVIQRNFMSNELRIVVATIAFGMGINKADIRCVIHFNMPAKFESYVQEIGRAGRDGLPARCHVFFDEVDLYELARHVYSNTIDRHTIRKLLRLVFVPCKCVGICKKHEVMFSENSTVSALDTPKEIIETLLCYLELDQTKYVQILKPSYGKCKILSYGGHELFVNVSKTCQLLKTALELYGSKEEHSNVLEFPVLNVAKILNHDVGIFKRILKNLEWTNVNGTMKRSGLTIEFSDLSFHLSTTGNLPDEDLDKVLDNLYRKVTEQEESEYSQLNHIYNSLQKASMKSFKLCENASDKSEILKAEIREYFESDCRQKNIIIPDLNENDELMILIDIRSIIGMYSDESFTGRSIARIFHGISSPNFPAYIWGRTKFWRRHLRIHFNNICKIATRELVKSSNSK